MRGYSGHYYEKLSPVEVLGINAETEEDMRHFAEISAKQEHDKLERELKFNGAFHEAPSRLFSGEQILKSFDLAPFKPILHNEK
jgi:integrating conjugative element protein (TIGR03759 family)